MEKLNFKLDRWDALLLVTMFVFISLFIVPSLEYGYNNWEQTIFAFLLEMLFALPIIILNVKVLMPYFFVKNRVWWYFPALVIIIAPLLFPYNLVSKLYYSHDPVLMSQHGFKIERIGIFIWMQLRHVTIMSLVLIIRRLVFARQSIAELEKEKQITELNLLKSQINPHFYFNTLNNLYALALKKSDLAPDSILRLSKLMEYVIYDCKENYVSFAKEMNFIKNYIELEKLRYENDAKIKLEIIGTENNFQLIPMVLIQFIENAFKHGLSKYPEGFIKISISISNDSLVLIVQNSFQESENKSKGIGIENTIRRLESYYENRYTLDISQKENIYKVRLELPNANV